MVSGSLDQGGHESDPGDPRTRHHEQRPAVRDAQRLQHVDAEHQERQEGGPRHLHVPGQHGPHEEPGEPRTVIPYLKQINLVHKH